MFLTKAAAIILIISAATARQSQPFTPRPRFYDEFTTGDDNRGNNLGKLSQLQLNHSAISISNADKKVALCTTTSSSPDYYPTFSLQNPFFAKKKTESNTLKIYQDMKFLSWKKHFQKEARRSLTQNTLPRTIWGWI